MEDAKCTVRGGAGGGEGGCEGNERPQDVAVAERSDQPEYGDSCPSARNALKSAPGGQTKQRALWRSRAAPPAPSSPLDPSQTHAPVKPKPNAAAWGVFHLGVFLPPVCWGAWLLIALRACREGEGVRVRSSCGLICSSYDLSEACDLVGERAESQIQSSSCTRVLAGLRFASDLLRRVLLLLTLPTRST